MSQQLRRIGHQASARIFSLIIALCISAFAGDAKAQNATATEQNRVWFEATGDEFLLGSNGIVFDQVGTGGVTYTLFQSGELLSWETGWFMSAR